MLDGDNCEDVSFFFSNLVFYYPEWSRAGEGEREDLVKFLEGLSKNLRIDLLLHMYSM